MGTAGRGEALPNEASGTSLERQRPEIAEAVGAYLKLANGDARQALALAVADAIGASQLVSRGFARWGQPDRFS